MGWIIQIVIALVITGALWWAGSYVGDWARRHRQDRTIDVDMLDRTRMAGIALRVGAVVIGVLWIGLATLVNSVHQVDAGHVGVVRTFGDITAQTGAGLVVTWPFQSLEEASVRVERYDVTDIEAFSKETQDVFARVTVNYQVSPRAIQTLYKDVGSKYIDTLLRPRVINFFKETTVTYSTVTSLPTAKRSGGRCATG